MHKKVFIIQSLLVASTVFAVGIALAKKTNIISFANPKLYQISFNSSHNKLTTSTVVCDGEQTVQTNLNNSVNFAYAGLLSSSSSWQIVDNGGSFYNLDPISGIESLSFSFLDSNLPYKIYWSNNGEFSEENSSSHVTSNTNPTNIDFNSTYPNYFKFVSTGSSSIVITSGSVSYSCTNYNPALRVTCNNTDFGSITVSSNQPSPGSEVSLTAWPNQGYGFDGWFANEELVSSSNPYNFSMPYHEINLEAKFSAKTYTFTLDANGGDAGQSTIDITYNQPYSLPIPTRNGYTFDGWYFNGKYQDWIALIPNSGTWNYWYQPYSTWFEARWIDDNTYASVDFTFDSENNCYSVSNKSTSIEGVINIPEYYQGYPVTDVPDFGFANCSSLTAVHLPDSIKTIGDKAFKWVDGDMEVNIPNNIETIGPEAFKWLNCFTSIDFPESLVTIGTSAFNSCVNLTSVSFGSHLECISGDAFKGCTNLGGYVFIPENVTTVGYSIFENSSLTRVYCEATSKPDGWSADWNENYIQPVWGAFEESTTFFQNGIEYFINSKGRAFVLSYNGESTNLVIPTDVSKTGSTYFYVRTIASYAFKDNTSIQSVTLPNKLEEISDYAFMNCTSLVSSELQGNVATNIKKIGDGAYFGCTSLQDVTTGNLLEYLGKSAFAGCSALRGAIAIPSGISIIQESTFYNCSSLEDVYFSSPTLTTIGKSAFYGCTSLERLNNFQLTGIETINKNTFYGCSSLVSVTMPNTVTVVDEAAFSQCSGLTTVTFSNQLVRLAKQSFYNCTNLSSVTLPSTARTIGESAFCGCTNLTSVELPDGLVSIIKEAFYNCSSLPTIFIPISVTTIGTRTFNYCSSLTILCEATEKPENWHNNWNNTGCPVTWGASRP